MEQQKNKRVEQHFGKELSKTKQSEEQDQRAVKGVGEVTVIHPSSTSPSLTYIDVSTDHTLPCQMQVAHYIPPETKIPDLHNAVIKSKSKIKSLSLSKHQKDSGPQFYHQESNYHPVLSTSSPPTTASFSVHNFTHNKYVQNPPKVVPTKQHTLPSTKSSPTPNDTFYSCNICNKYFGHRSSLYKHTKLNHPEQLNQGKIKCQENICNFTCKQVSQLRLHLQVKHGMKMHMEDKYFSNYEGNYTDIRPVHMYDHI